MKRLVTIQHSDFFTDEHNELLLKVDVQPAPFRFGSRRAQALLGQLPETDRNQYERGPGILLLRVEDNKILAWTGANPEEAEIRSILRLKESHYNADPPIAVEAAADTPHLSIAAPPEEEPVGLYASRLGTDQPATPYIPATDDQV